MQQITVIPSKFSTTTSQMCQSSTRYNYRAVLKTALKESVYKRMETHWIQNLGVKEKKGIKVLEAIINTKGCKRFEKNKYKTNHNDGKFPTFGGF